MSLTNNKAKFEYHILESEIVGIVLIGSEVSPLKESKASITESFVWIDEDNNSVYIKNMYIKNEINSAYTHEEFRERKLLMTKKQIKKWAKEVATQGVTIVPLRAFFDTRNRLKLEIALCRGKKLYDKRNTLKTRDIERYNQRELN
jgi:SsrA-binding protein